MVLYRQKKDIAWRDIRGEAVLIDPENGIVFVLNEAGLHVWTSLEEARSPAEVACALSLNYQKIKSQIEADVLRFIKDLSRRGLIEEVNEGTGSTEIESPPTMSEPGGNGQDSQEEYKPPAITFEKMTEVDGEYLPL